MVQRCAALCSASLAGETLPMAHGLAGFKASRGSRSEWDRWSGPRAGRVTAPGVSPHRVAWRWCARAGGWRGRGMCLSAPPCCLPPRRHASTKSTLCCDPASGHVGVNNDDVPAIGQPGEPGRRQGVRGTWSSSMPPPTWSRVIAAGRVAAPGWAPAGHRYFSWRARRGPASQAASQAARRRGGVRALAPPPWSGRPRRPPGYDVPAQTALQREMQGVARATPRPAHGPAGTEGA